MGFANDFAAKSLVTQKLIFTATHALFYISYNQQMLPLSLMGKNVKTSFVIPSDKYSHLLIV